MRLLIDTNVSLDVLQNREPYVKDSSVIWKLCEAHQAEGFISALTFANLVYIMRKELNPRQTEYVLQKLSLIFTFTELSPSDLTSAARLQWNDFEDALQSMTAERIHGDYLVMRNMRDFLRSRVAAFTPSELCGRIRI